MYGRSIDDVTYTWEPSGGLLHAGLVMRDRETDSWWSITTSDAIWGDAKGTRMQHLPGSEKATFGEWKTRHPETLVLSVEGVEHKDESPYDRYFESDSGFRDLAATDHRLADKAQIFGFHFEGVPHAIPLLAVQGGVALHLGDRQLFLYREPDDSHYRSSTAVVVATGARMVESPDGWQVRYEDGRTATFDPATRRFGGSTKLVRPLEGFDTFWYIWSLTNPDTLVHDP